MIKVSRAWVETSSILRMSLPVEPPKSLKALKTGPLKNRLSKAINMAEQAKMMRKEERLEKYSFATLFKGKWGLHPDTDSDEDEDTLDGEMEAVEGTPESFKLPALKARKAHKYVNQVNKEGGYFSPKYVPVNPGLQSDDVM